MSPRRARTRSARRTRSWGVRAVVWVVIVLFSVSAVGAIFIVSK